MRSLKLLAGVAVTLAFPGVASAGSLFLIDGRGWGHGVGMGQWGAEGYAAHGWRHEQILAHYYPGTSISATHPGSVRVVIAEARQRVRITSSLPFLVHAARGHVRHARHGIVLTPRSRLPVTFTPGAAPLTLDGAGYRGELTVRRGAGGLVVVNELPIERYLRGVVPAEMPTGWHAEAYEAQAIAARSYVIAKLDPASPFDLYADDRSQMYGGVRSERPQTNLAVGATAGQVLTYRGRVIAAYYHSSSGGRTAAVQDVWDDKSPKPYLVSVSDPYDGISPNHRWGPFAETTEELGRKLDAPRLRDVVVEHSDSGFATRVHILGARTSRIVSAQAFAQALGLRSTAFSVRVLSLSPPVRPAAHDKPFSLDGFVRGLGGVRLQQLSPTRGWLTVARIRTLPDGRFHATIRPRQSTSYRLAVGGLAGPIVNVRVAKT